jgi:hypothetical protein
MTAVMHPTLVTPPRVAGPAGYTGTRAKLNREPAAIEPGQVSVRIHPIVGMH